MKIGNNEITHIENGIMFTPIYDLEDYSIEEDLEETMQCLKKAKEEIEEIFEDENWYSNYSYNDLENKLKDVLEILDKENKQIMKKLYELPENKNVKLYIEDKVIIFGHLDGFYSYCWLEEDKNKIVHIKATTLFKKYKDGYKCVEETK